jgi:hypothetical protein
MIADNLGVVNHGGQSTLKAFGLACQAHEEFEVFVAKKPEQATLRAHSTYLAAGNRLRSTWPRRSELLERRPYRSGSKLRRADLWLGLLLSDCCRHLRPPESLPQNQRQDNDIPTGRQRKAPAQLD